jgi:hypothetical protein
VDANRTRKAPWMVAGAVALWAAAGGYLVPALIASAYRGESWPFLNALIRGQRDNPLEYYLEKWSFFFWLLLLALAAFWLLVAFLPPASLTRQSLRAAWRSYWFRPAPLGYLAAMRITCAGVQLWLLLAMDVYNQERLREQACLPDALYDPLPALRLFLWPWGAGFRPSLEALTAVYWITAAAGAGGLVGFGTNLCLLLFAAGSTFLQAYYYSFGDLHHPEALMVLALWALAFSPAGRALSVDSLLARGPRASLVAGAKERSIYAAWPLLLLAALLGVVYLDSAVKKLWVAGLDWMNGETLQFYLFADASRRGSELGLWLARQHTLAWLLSWVTIVFEATFFLVLFWPRLAWVYVPLGLGLHAGMAVPKVAWFYQFMALYVVFLPQLLGLWAEPPWRMWRRSAQPAQSTP